MNEDNVIKLPQVPLAMVLEWSHRGWGRITHGHSWPLDDLHEWRQVVEKPGETRELEICKGWKPWMSTFALAAAALVSNQNGAVSFFWTIMSRTNIPILLMTELEPPVNWSFQNSEPSSPLAVKFASLCPTPKPEARPNCPMDATWGLGWGQRGSLLCSTDTDNAVHYVN